MYKDNNHVWSRNCSFCGNNYCDDNMKSKPNYMISLKHILIVAKNHISSSKKEKNRDILKAFELNLHIAVFWKAVEFEFWNHLDLLWKTIGKVKWNLKLCLSWNKLKNEICTLESC